MKTKKIFLLAMAVFSLAACEKHDFIDDLVITGEVGPQAYWEVGSSMAAAGTEVPFVAQYYTSVKDVKIDHSEVWYNITEVEEKTIICPWVTTFTYNITSALSQEKRVSQLIKSYPHQAEINDSLHAYVLEDAFPVSGTLAPFVWQKPQQWTEADSISVETYFGQGFQKHFIDSLYNKMQYADFKNMLLGLSKCESFAEYTDSTFNENSNGYIYHFPDSVIPQAVTDMYYSIPFQDFIFNKADGAYDVNYKRSYQVRAQLRVYDDRGVYGTTQPKDIEIN